jgi:outer membrane protein assembly factor BamB
MMKRTLPLLAVCCILTSTLTAAAGDWPSWRGPNRDGISLEKNLLAEWSDDGPPLAWQVEGVGRGYSSLVVSEDRIFTMGEANKDKDNPRKKRCYLIALSSKDGSELWATEVSGGNPNCTPTVDGDRVYALARDGVLACINAESGELLWNKSYPQDFGGKMMSGWGYSESPLIDGDRLICTPGSSDAMIAALDKATGSVIWQSSVSDLGSRGRDGAAYSSIVISEAAGVKQYVQLTGRGIVSVDAEDGTLLWSYNRIANGTANISTPLVRGDHVFCSTGYGTGAALLKIVRDGDALKAEEVYFLNARDMQNHHGGMVLFGDHIYCGNGHNKGFPLCINLLTGEQAWNGGRGPGGGSAAVLLADGHLYFRYEDGTMALIEATPDEYRLKGEFKVATAASKNRNWQHPVIVDGLLYIRDQNTLMCYDIRKQ